MVVRKRSSAATNSEYGQHGQRQGQHGQGQYGQGHGQGQYGQGQVTNNHEKDNMDKDKYMHAFHNLLQTDTRQF